MFEEKTESLATAFFQNLGKIFYWQDASKGYFISFCTSFMCFTFLLWWGLHYVYLISFGFTYLPYSESELIQAIGVCIFSMTLLSITFAGSIWSVYKNKFQKMMLNISLTTVCFSLSMLLSIIGVFDGISWLIVLIYSFMGLLFISHKKLITVIFMLIFLLIIFSICSESLPFKVRAYQFTNTISLETMSATALFASWVKTLVTTFFCLTTIYLLIGAWQNREKDLWSKSFVDELTGLYNRRAIQIGLKEEFFRARRGEYSLSVAMLDLDHFKKVNDDYGHPFGDEILKIIADLIKEVARNVDLVGRYGGEEFLIVFPECDAIQAKNILDTLRENISNSEVIAASRKSVKISISAGVAELNDYDSFEDIIKRSDIALYQAKKQGRNRVING